MRHDWIFEVLGDLRTYALANDMPLLAQKVDETLRVARAEVARIRSDGPPDGGVPPGAKSH